MPPGIADALVFKLTKSERAVQHFAVFGAGKPGGFIFCFRNNTVRVVDADFRTGIDAVLSFPKFNQPCAAPVIKIDGKGVENHLETGRHMIVKPGIPGLSLWGVHCGGKKAAATVKIVAEGIYQLV